MWFDGNNKVSRLCAQGMALEGQNEMDKAASLFRAAWNEAENDFEKYVAAHYVARRQGSPAKKLEWDMIALEHALRIDAGEVRATYPSLYLNIAKCYEDLADFVNARRYYELAHSYTHLLPGNGYGTMIGNGIKRGMAQTICLIDGAGSTDV